MNSRPCRWLIVSVLLITGSGVWAQRSAPPASDQKVNQGCEGIAPAPTEALQAQKSNAHKLLLNSIPHEFTDGALMTNMKWTEETFFQGIISNWDTYKGEQGFKEKDVLRAAEVEICGVAFSVTAARFKSDGAYDFIFSTKLDEGFPKDFREQFMGYAEKIWGVPSKDIDYSTEAKDDSVVHPSELDTWGRV